MHRALAVLVVPLLGLATVAVGPGIAAAADSLDAVAVAGPFGEKPTVTVPAPFSVRTSASDVRVEGKGEKAARGSRVSVDYVLLNGRTGDEIESSFGAEPPTLQLGKQSPRSVVKGLVGQAIGSRVVVAVAPKDGLTANGASAGVQKNDTLLFVMDLRAVLPSRATGTAVTPPAGLPTVELGAKGTPTITIPKSEPPTELVVQPLIRGDGPVVTPGQQLTVHYTGVLWRNGKAFDSSWTRGEPATFTIGADMLIDAWDEGLVGRTVGSQVLLVVPPAKGYGDAGQPSAGIEGTDTLVFVVDILGAT